MTSIFTIAIAAYNAELFIEQAVRSALEQTDCAVEIIVCDDASTDRTAEIVADLPVQLIRRAVNGGRAAALNDILKVAQGEYIVLLDADDWCSPDRIARMRDRASASNDEVITTDAFYVSGEPPWERHYEIYRFVHNEQLQALVDGNFVFGGAAVRCDALRRLGGFRTGLKASEDFDLWLRLLLTGGRIGLLAEPLYYYRQHGSNITNDIERLIQADVAAMRLAIDEGLVSGDQVELLRRAIRSRLAGLPWHRINAARAARRPPFRRDLASLVLGPSQATGRTRLKAAAAVLVPKIWR